MVFCSNCGEKLPENAYFCPKCGVMTAKGVEAGIAQREDLEKALTRMGEELEKAFLIAAREIEKAFKMAREKMSEAISREPIVCSACGEKNIADAQFCYKCGKKLK